MLKKYLFFLFFLLSASFASAAYPLENISVDSNRLDFVVGPGKQEYFLKPGETVTAEILVSNRMGEERIFELSTEDFSGSRNVDETVKLLGSDRGPYSLKDYITFSDSKFVLPNGTRARIPVKISIPVDAEPGGLYGSLLVSTVKSIEKTETEGASGGVPIQIRQGVLFFIRIPGDVKEDGRLTDFKLLNNEKIISGGENLNFQLVFENNGSVHLNPFGEISILNIQGEEVNNLEVSPWYSLPDSLRSRDVVINSGMMMGRYKAVAKIYKGFGDIKDNNSYDILELSFWVVPWKRIAIILLVVTVLVFAIRWFRKNFEFKRK